MFLPVEAGFHWRVVIKATMSSDSQKEREKVALGRVVVMHWNLSWRRLGGELGEERGQLKGVQVSLRLGNQRKWATRVPRGHTVHIGRQQKGLLCGCLTIWS